MFLTLLAVTFTVSLLVAAGVVRLFDRPVAEILQRVVTGPLSAAWHRYIKFALLVVAVGGGVRIWELERYISPRNKDEPVLVLNAERWVLEVYRTIIATLQSAAWMLLVVFLVALVAYVVVRGFEVWAERAAARKDVK
ncbi:MAG TPA: hypothetical protein VEG34_13240 [Thermoanaerobaculia bacterium]|nr:hypothetical protein [Thermoanaerobaculia bacterium]